MHSTMDNSAAAGPAAALSLSPPATRKPPDLRESLKRLRRANPGRRRAPALEPGAAAEYSAAVYYVDLAERHLAAAIRLARAP